MFGKAEPLGWLYYADNSYVATRLLWFTDLPLDSAVYAHRTIELYIKAFLVSRGVDVKPGSPAWGHDLSALGEAAAKYDPGFGKEAVARRLRFFERYFDYVRYPGDLVAPMTAASRGSHSMRTSHRSMSLSRSSGPAFVWLMRIGSAASSTHFSLSTTMVNAVISAGP